MIVTSPGWGNIRLPCFGLEALFPAGIVQLHGRARPLNGFRSMSSLDQSLSLPAPCIRILYLGP